MDKVKFFAILLPVLIGLAFLFKILLPIVIGAIAIFIITMIFFAKKGKASESFFTSIRAREPARYVCLECGFYHSGESCPRCGSKIKKFYQ